MIVTDATNELLEQYYGHRMKQSMKAVVAIEDGKPVGVSGFKYENNAMIWFADFSDEMREHPAFKRTMIKGFRKLIDRIPRMNIYAMCDPDIKGADTLLKHLGFRLLGGNVWQV